MMWFRQELRQLRPVVSAERCKLRSIGTRLVLVVFAGVLWLIELGLGAAAAGQASAAQADPVSASQLPARSSSSAAAVPGTQSAKTESAGKTEKKSGKRKGQKEEAAAPLFSIPVEPLGFAPPAIWYLGQRVSLMSLDFLDENRLLFTFRVPGLIARQPRGAAESPVDDEGRGARHVRAVVLELPSGKVVADDLWVLHDSARYLWPLKDGRFLLRDRNQIDLVDKGLHRTAFLRFPGVVQSLELPPDQKLVIANSVEPAATDTSGKDAAKKDLAGPGAALDEPAAAASAGPNVVAGQTRGQTQDQGEKQQQRLLRVLKMDSHAVVFVARVSGLPLVPVDDSGFYEASRGKGRSWDITFNGFTGGSRKVGSVDSSCQPMLDVVATGVVVTSTCTDRGAFHLAALRLTSEQANGHLWDLETPVESVWPEMGLSAGGRRLVRSTIEASHPIAANSPLDREDMRAQRVEVLDVMTGLTPLMVKIAPIQDAGGNFALSPGGSRLAVLNRGAIEVYSLPAEQAPAEAAKSGKEKGKKK